MYYLILSVLSIIVLSVLVKLLKSIFRAVMFTIFLLVVGVASYTLVKSTQEPVTVLNRYKIDNLEISRLVRE